MSEGGDITFENPAYEPDDDDDDNVDETAPFLPQTSTPHTSGETFGMRTRQHEASGLPETSFAETSFGATVMNRAWEAAKDLFPNISATDLEVSYSKKGKLQVKMFGAGKKQYSLFTTDRGTRQESINKGLPSEIRKALGESKAEMVEKKKKEEQKKLKQKELAARTEGFKNEFDSIMNEIEKNKEELEREKNSDYPDQDKIKKLQGKSKNLELKRLKTKKALDESILHQKDVEALAEDLAEQEENEEEVTKNADQLRTLRKHKENLIRRKNQELDYFLHDPNFAVKLDPNLSPEEQLKQKNECCKNERGVKKKN